MPHLTIKNSKESTDINLFYEDYGSGQPVILIHGWPVTHNMWSKQVAAIVEAGYRCIAYDRRGFGESSKPWSPYDYTTLASDLKEIIDQLRLTDSVLCGFSMGGGEVVRYLTDHGDSKVAKAILISSIIPLVPKKPDNPKGVPVDALEGMTKQMKADYPGFLEGFNKNFYNYADNKDTVSEAILHYDWSLAIMAATHAVYATAASWASTDFRPELKNVTVPTLIVHGDDDQIVPIGTAGDQAAQGIKDNTYKVFKKAPHGLFITHAEELNKEILQFLAS